jgi:hypothetical protein
MKDCVELFGHKIAMCVYQVALEGNKAICLMEIYKFS